MWESRFCLRNCEKLICCAQILLLSPQIYLYATYQLQCFLCRADVLFSTHPLEVYTTFVKRSDEELSDLAQDDTMTASQQNVNGPVQLSLIHFLCIWAFSQSPLNGGGVTTLNWVPVFVFQWKVNLLARFCLLFTFLHSKSWQSCLEMRSLL